MYDFEIYFSFSLNLKPLRPIQVAAFVISMVFFFSH